MDSRAGAKVGGEAGLARGVARRSQCQASQNSSLGALNLSARAEGFASPGVRSRLPVMTGSDPSHKYKPLQRRGERKVGRRRGEDHLEERLLSHKYVTILRYFEKFNQMAHIHSFCHQDDYYDYPEYEDDYYYYYDDEEPLPSGPTQ